MLAMSFSALDPLRSWTEHHSITSSAVARSADGNLGRFRTLQDLPQTIPIVFVTVADRMRAGFVASLSRLGGNLNGFINFKISIASG